ncbi:hypothetical protein Fmac_003935 [Flemingia macrophylla]|uniref:Bidirectional sugar transporter SWEET n=1 Tax=Flemingia macrophylla TaxID=520843 RepID=A0ABD1N634_9FABA
MTAKKLRRIDPLLGTMNAAEIARTVVGIIGNIISGAMFLAPAYFYRNIQEGISGTVLTSTVPSYVSELHGLDLVRTTHDSPTQHFGDGRKRLRVFLILLVELIFIAALTVITLTTAHTTKKRSAIVGTTCIIFNIMMYASPLSVMKLVITTKSVEYMPFFISLASFANGVAWTTYALIRFDPFITIPNGLGTLFATAQLILYATYYKSTKRQIAARKANKEVNMSQVVMAGQESKPEDKIDRDRNLVIP